jgi:glycosyltransferase involved in cell wall biosynthesis
MSNRVLLLSWEYPPVIEGGLARHVRKLAEALVRKGVGVLRDRLVTEASEHVLRFDWDDNALRTRGIYDGLGQLTAREGVRRG